MTGLFAAMGGLSLTASDRHRRARPWTVPVAERRGGASSAGSTWRADGAACRPIVAVLVLRLIARGSALIGIDRPTHGHRRARSWSASSWSARRTPETQRMTTPVGTPTASHPPCSRHAGGADRAPTAGGPAAGPPAGAGGAASRDPPGHRQPALDHEHPEVRDPTRDPCRVPGRPPALTAASICPWPWSRRWRGS